MKYLTSQDAITISSLFNFDVRTEIFEIEQEIYNAAKLGNYEVVINESLMTEYPVTPESTAYFDVFKGTVTNKRLTENMNAVLQHFTDNGFAIVQREKTTATSFEWVINW